MPLPAPGMKKEKTVNDDRITYRQLGQLIDGRDRPAAHAIENAARESTPPSRPSARTPP